MQSTMITVELEEELAEEALQLLEQIFHGNVSVAELASSLAIGHLRYRLEQAVEQH